MPKSKHSTLPAKFEPGFLRDLDGRTELSRRLDSTYNAIVADVGGEENLSHIKLSLIERFVFLEAMLQSTELQLASSPAGKPSPELIGRWVQGLNSLLGLAKTLGLERRLSKANLRTYVEGRNA